ncbi:MAG: TonB-dependent receptor domain-containing protein, partial [Rhodothermia bacterium]
SEAVNTIDLVGTYNMKLSESFKSRTSIGGQYLGVLFQGTSSTGLLIVAGSSSIAGAAQTTSVESTTERRTVGVFIEEQINFREKLFLTAAVRSDRGSAFGASLESVFYPKVSASWLVSNESFFNSEGLVSSLRLRGAWGDSGVQPGTNDAIRFFTPIAATVDGGQSVTGVTFGGVGNADLKAERSREIELGVDATMFSNRLGIELTYFNKNTQDALVFRQLPLSLGVGAGRFENLGSVKNTGLEVGLNMRIVNSSKASFDLDFTGTFIDTELTELGEGIEPVIFNQVQRHTEGFPLGGYWDKPFTFSDANGDGLIAKDEVQVGDEAVYLGTPFAPTDLFFTGNLGLFGDKLVVRALLNYRGGQTLYNNTGAWRNGNSNTDELNDPSTPLEDQARAIASKFFGTNAGYIEDASFWRLREISLTYFFPEKMLTSAGLSRLSLTLSGQNVAVFTSYTGLDPEISSTGQSNFDAEEFLSQPPVRAWKARLNMSF